MFQKTDLERKIVIFSGSNNKRFTVVIVAMAPEVDGGAKSLANVGIDK